MTSGFDRSHKDKQYFIDNTTYNCPFCKRCNIKYYLNSMGFYNSSNTKTVYFYLIECTDCNKISLHLSHHKFNTWSLKDGTFQFSQPLQRLVLYQAAPDLPTHEQPINAIDGECKKMDDLFFYHMPTAFFTIDERIPSAIREPLSEADNCLKSNFLTGASACLRKAIYKLLQHENIRETIKHDKRIEQLKKKHPKIDASLLDALKKIHVLTSKELHENDWQDFDSHALRFLLETTKEVLIEIFVLPDEKTKRNKVLNELEEKAKGIRKKNDKKMTTEIE